MHAIVDPLWRDIDSTLELVTLTWTLVTLSLQQATFPYVALPLNSN